MSGEVYFIVCMDRVKIGHTRVSVQSRLSSLQTGCPYPLSVIYSEPGTRESEKYWHSMFAGYRLIGEWFWLEPVWDHLVCTGRVEGRMPCANDGGKGVGLQSMIDGAITEAVADATASLQNERTNIAAERMLWQLERQDLLRRLDGDKARQKHSQATSKALRNISRRGGFTGGPAPFGYRLAKSGGLEEYPAEQRAIAIVAELRASGLSLRQIAAHLDAEGIKTRKGTRIQARQIGRILNRADQ